MQEPANHADQVKRLETESRQLLSALKWSTRVRNMLLIAMVAFAAGAGALFYGLFQEIRNSRLAETQQLFIERQDEFLEPLTQAALDVAQTAGPEVFHAFREQFTNDSSRYLQVMGQQRDAIAQSLKQYLEQRVRETHTEFLQENEAILVETFPELKDPKCREIFERNLAAAFEEIGRRYYVKYFDAEYQRLVEGIDRFPALQPENRNTPVAKQLAAETAKLFQMLATNVSGSPLDENAYVMAGLLTEHRQPTTTTESTYAAQQPMAEQAQPATHLSDSTEDH